MEKNVSAGTIAAILASAAAVVSSIVAWFRLETERKERLAQHEEERRRWISQFGEERERGIAEWDIEFLHELVERRLASYPPVFATLGAVIDIDDPDSRVDTDESPTRLLEVAQKIMEHLYGEAGLLMPMKTRNHLHTARLEALKWYAGHGDHDDLVNAFFYARRRLRADIQIGDSKDIETALQDLKAERRLTPRSVRSAASDVSGPSEDR
jgi:hypothetical protein